MKNIIFILLLFSFTSCDDWLNVEAEDAVTFQNYFKNEQDLESIVITMFGHEKLMCYGSGSKIMTWSALQCDNAGEFENYRQMDPDKFLSDQGERDWMTQYKSIYLADLLKENRFRFENITKERADYWIAQGNFVKAFAYFDLARKWGEAPIAIGTENVESVGKSSVMNVLQEAIGAANAALILPKHEQLTDAKGVAVTSKQYASLGTVHTLLANIYAWMGGLYGEKKYWEEAEKHASMVIDGKVGYYELEPSVKDMVQKTLGKARTSSETIFSLEINDRDDKFLDGGTQSLIKIFPGYYMINYPYMEVDCTKIEKLTERKTIPSVTVATVEEIYPEERDTRRQEYWYKLGEVVSKYEYTDWDENGIPIDSVPVYSEYAFLNKWRDPIRPSNQDKTNTYTKPVIMEGNRVIWRLADLILLRAECRAQLGLQTAVNDLNRVRKRAGLRDYNGSTGQENLLREIYYERERELYGEGQRYFDIVRNGYYRDELLGNYKLLTDTDVKRGALYLPVSDNARRKNPLMKQNVYWSWKER